MTPLIGLSNSLQKRFFVHLTSGGDVGVECLPEDVRDPGSIPYVESIFLVFTLTQLQLP